MTTEQALVSVVIPVYNAAGTIRQTIEAVQQQHCRAHEIIVVDDGSTDATASVLQSFGAQIRYVRQSNQGPAAARNCGVRAATGEFIAFTDSDCLPQPDWLCQLLRGFTADQIAGVGGLIRHATQGLIGEYVDVAGFLNPRPGAHNEIPYLITANACFRRAALLQAGLFDERFRKPGGEEPELCLRLKTLGYEFRRADKALVLHHHRQTVASLLKTLANYGEGAFVFGQIAPAQRWQRPRARLARLLLRLPLFAQRVPAYRRQFGLAKACCFSLLDALREIAFVAGYLRGMRRAA